MAHSNLLVSPPAILFRVVVSGLIVWSGIGRGSRGGGIIAAVAIDGGGIGIMATFGPPAARR
jgi:hypothetical protein